MTAMSVRQIQALDISLFEDSARDLLNNCADWVHTFSDLLLIAHYGKFGNSVWLCTMDRNEVSLLNAKMIKRVM